jgi:hypothetical protein
MKNGITIYCFSLLLGFSLSSSCKKSPEVAFGNKLKFSGYDVILFIGQSNTHQGIGIDPQLDAPDQEIQQLGRWEGNNLKIILAKDPMDHWKVEKNTIGFGLTFAKRYKAKYLQPGRGILIIPASLGSSGFWSQMWNPGDTLYEDAVMRANYVIQQDSGRLVAMLWHQGESDVGNVYYQQSQDSMIVQIRRDITGAGSVPFIVGGMVPYWVQQDMNRMKLQATIKDTPNRIFRTGYADPTIPFVIEKPDNQFIPVHYDAAGQREMGARYFAEFVRLNECSMFK